MLKIVVMSSLRAHKVEKSVKVLRILRHLVVIGELQNLVEEDSLANEIADQRRWWVRPINERRNSQGASEQLIREMQLHDNESFFAFTRLSIAQFDELLMLVGPSILKKNTRKDVLSPHTRLLITLRFLATGESFASLHFLFRVGRSTIAKVIYSTCAAIHEALKPECLPALTCDRFYEITAGFRNRTTYPHIIGAIDGKHINIKSPKNSGTNFFNYKKTFSIVLLAVCDAEYRFTYVTIGGYGSESDGGVFRNSTLGAMLDKQQIHLPEPMPVDGVRLPFFLLGDAAFPLRPYLMTPYAGRDLERSKSWHNRELSRGRCCIENAFGILSTRFRVFLTTMAIKPENADNIVMSAILLHNFILNRDHHRYANAAFVDQFNVDGMRIDGEWRNIVDNSQRPMLQPLAPRFHMGSRNASAEANCMRDTIKNILFNTAPHQPLN